MEKPFLKILYVLAESSFFAFIIILALFNGLSLNVFADDDPCIAKWKSDTVYSKYGDPPAGDIVMDIPQGVSIGNYFYFNGKWAQNRYKYPTASATVIIGFFNQANEDNDSLFFSHSQHGVQTFDTVLVHDVRNPSSNFSYKFKIVPKARYAANKYLRVEVQIIATLASGAIGYLRVIVYKIPVINVVKGSVNAVDLNLTIGNYIKEPVKNAQEIFFTERAWYQVVDSTNSQGCFQFSVPDTIDPISYPDPKYNLRILKLLPAAGAPGNNGNVYFDYNFDSIEKGQVQVWMPNGIYGKHYTQMNKMNNAKIRWSTVWGCLKWNIPTFYSYQCNDIKDLLDSWSQYNCSYDDIKTKIQSDSARAEILSRLLFAEIFADSMYYQAQLFSSDFFYDAYTLFTSIIAAKELGKVADLIKQNFISPKYEWYKYVIDAFRKKIAKSTFSVINNAVKTFIDGYVTNPYQRSHWKLAWNSTLGTILDCLYTDAIGKSLFNALIQESLKDLTIVVGNTFICPAYCGITEGSLNYPARTIKNTYPSNIPYNYQTQATNGDAIVAVPANVSGSMFDECSRRTTQWMIWSNFFRNSAGFESAFASLANNCGAYIIISGAQTLCGLSVVAAGPLLLKAAGILAVAGIGTLAGSMVIDLCAWAGFPQYVDDGVLRCINPAYNPAPLRDPPHWKFNKSDFTPALSVVQLPTKSDPFITGNVNNIQNLDNEYRNAIAAAFQAAKDGNADTLAVRVAVMEDTEDAMMNVFEQSGSLISSKDSLLRSDTNYLHSITSFYNNYYWSNMRREVSNIGFIRILLADGYTIDSLSQSVDSALYYLDKFVNLTNNILTGLTGSYTPAVLVVISDTVAHSNEYIRSEEPITIKTVVKNVGNETAKNIKLTLMIDSTFRITTTDTLFTDSLTVGEEREFDWGLITHDSTKMIGFYTINIVYDSTKSVMESDAFYLDGRVADAVSNEPPQPIGSYITSIIPNPAQNVAKIIISNASESCQWLSIYDVFGREIIRLLGGELLPVGDFAIYCDLSQFPVGVYFLKLTGVTTSSVEKIIIER